MDFGKSKYQRDDITHYKLQLSKIASQIANVHDSIIDQSTEDIPDLWTLAKPHTFQEIQAIVNKATVKLGQFGNYLERIKPYGQ